MKCGLHQTYASGPAFVRPIHDHLHQLPPDAGVLYVGIDGERADACDDGALVKYIAPDDAASAFGHHAVEVSAGEHLRKEPDGRLRSGKIAREIVRRVDCRKGSVGNLAADGAVLRQRRTHYQVRLRFRSHTLDILLVRESIAAGVNPFETYVSPCPGLPVQAALT